MRQLLPSRSLAALAAVGFAACLSTMAMAGTDCRPAAIAKLRALAPDGLSVYQQIKDKDFFLTWVTCDDIQLGLATAVHESVHYITSDIDAFPLLGGGVVARPHEVSALFAPSLIAKKFKASDFVTTYLRPGQASSATDFLYLLDELNAYTHDLNAAIDLNSLHPADEDVAHRDGLAAAMAFVAIYVQTAAESKPDTWSALQTPTVAKTVSALWTRAETVMASSCGIPNFGSEDKGYIRQICQPKVRSSMATILGRAPACPTACLTEVTSDGVAASEPDAPSSPSQAEARPMSIGDWLFRAAATGGDPARGSR